MSKSAHLPSLDGLRGLAILLVIAHNAQLLEAPQMGATVKATYLMLNFGWVGVQLFFVLSGFLITGILLDTLGTQGGLKNFIARRALRIFPLYYGALLFIFVLLPALNLQPDIYKAQAPTQIWLWAYLSNWTNPLGIGPNALPHFWSLAVEEQFYLIWPLLVLAVRTPQGVAWLSLAMAAMAMASRGWLMHMGASTDFIYSATICRMDALTLGAFVAACWRIPSCVNWFQAHIKPIIVCTLVLFIATGLWTRGFPRASYNSQLWGYTALAIAFAVMTAVAAWQDTHQTGRPSLWQALLTLRPLKVMGKYSYGVYVVHKPLHDLFSMRALKALGIVTEGSILFASLHLVALTLAALGLAWLSFHLYEVHFLNLKRHFEQRSSGQAVKSERYRQSGAPRSGTPWTASR